MIRTRYRRPYYITLIATLLFIGIYFYLRRCNPSDASEIVVTILAIVAGVAFWLEYHHNSQVNEAEFIIELNNQFLTNEKLCQVEHDLEKYNDLVRRGEKEAADKFIEEMENCIYSISKDERQQLVNYLVHLEGIAALVNSGVLKLSTINDLMAYRYFIAVNNPAVQRLELNPFEAYYQGISGLYLDWANKIGDRMPLKEHRWK